MYEEKQYDEYNQLIKFSRNGNVLGEYTYRPDGLRVSKKARGTKTNHIWDGSNIIAEVDDAGNLINNYIRGIEAIKDKDQKYYLYNGHGDVTQITSSVGNVLTKYDYDPFGVDLNRNVDYKNPWRYSGEYYDAEIGNIYLRNRYYDPEIGRFNTQDPIRSGLNWYTYCSNNPINRIDPMGLESFIIYAPDINEEGEDINKKQAEIVKKQFEEKYKTKCYVYQVNTAKEFKRIWDDLGYLYTKEDGRKQVEIDAVEIISHGHVGEDPNDSDYGIGYLMFGVTRVHAAKNNLMGQNDIIVSDLSPKEIDYLYFSACNTANQDFKANIVDAFYNHNPYARTVIGWDGGVAFVFDSKRKYIGFEIEQDYPSATQRTFNNFKIKGNNPNREPGKIEKKQQYLLPAC